MLKELCREEELGGSKLTENNVQRQDGEKEQGEYRELDFRFT